MYMKLCPDGAEGASYSMLTTFSNIAGICSSNLGNLFAGIWLDIRSAELSFFRDVSNNAMKANNISGFWRLHVLTSCIALFPIALLSWLPKNEEEQDKLRKSPQRSKVGGAIFLFVLFASLTWSIVAAVLKLRE